MDKLMLAGIIRACLAALGGWLVNKGFATSSDAAALTSNADAIAGVVAVVASAAWSIWSKIKANKAKAAASKTNVSALLAVALIPALFLSSGCAVIFGKAGGSSYSGFAFGEKASSTLAGLNITETKKEKGNVVTESGVGVDSAGTSGQADMGKILGNLLLLGLQSQGVPVKAPAVSDEAVEADVDAEPVAVDAEPAAMAYSSDGYGGSPGESGVGVYGRPSCSRCRAYHNSHAETPIINIDDTGNRAAMWSALKARGFTGASAALPIVISKDGYTLSAK